jgi:hypothetical protein
MAVKLRRRPRHRPREFALTRILGWADTYHQRNGAWPYSISGPISESLGDSWRKVDSALRYGLRGLPGGSSLARLLAEQRQVRNPAQLPPFRKSQILHWADAHYRRTGVWPTSKSGLIVDAGETWRAVDNALRIGFRGLPGKSSLAQLLVRHRGVRHNLCRPRFKVWQILAWADAHHRRTGQWPNRSSGPVSHAATETWKGINTALFLGRRGLRGGLSLARLLAQRRGVRNAKQLPRLTLQQVRDWALAHRRRTGQWPTVASGPIPGAPGETWSTVGSALINGCRGLPAGLTFKRVFGVPTFSRKTNQTALTVRQILAWADAHHQRTGVWPHSRSGSIAEAPGETWRGVDQALRVKQRGLRFGGSLVRLLKEQRGRQTRYYQPRLTERQILAWARLHYRATGSWPNLQSGSITDAIGETWRAVGNALANGCRGLRRGGSLAQLLAQRCGIRNRTNLPRLTPTQIIRWAKAYHQRTRTWPTLNSGAVHEAAGETWRQVDQALYMGYRGLRGGESLARFLARTCGVRNRTNLPPLNIQHIVNWARAHFLRTGSWPTNASGTIVDALDETWKGIEMALERGHRGLPGGSSLARLRREFHDNGRPPLTAGAAPPPGSRPRARR